MEWAWLRQSNAWHNVTMFWNFVGTANFLAVEVTVWTWRSCQTISLMAWEWSYGKWRNMEIYLQHWSPIFLYWYECSIFPIVHALTSVDWTTVMHILFYIIYGGTLWQMPRSYIPFAFTKNSYHTYSTDQDLFLLVIYTTVCWRVLASQGSSTYRFATIFEYHILVISRTPDIISNLAWQQFKGSIH